MDKISNNYALPQGFEINPQRLNKQKERQAQINEQIRQIDPYIQDIKQNSSRLQQNYQPAQFQQRNSSRKNSSGNLQYYQHSSVQNSKPENNYKREYQMRPSSQLERANLAHEQAETMSMKRNSSQPRSYSQQAHGGRLQQEGAYMSGYGSRLLLPIPRRGDQDAIYQRQQKHYNIINCYPKQVINTHRNFPKYTLQNKLIENGHYPYYNANPQIQRNY